MVNMETREEMVIALKELENSFIKVCNLWSMNEKYFNEQMSDLFPFDKSFDEVAMDVINWSEKAVNKI